MNNKKYLIISDIHTHIDKAERIIKAEGADFNICLGDIFDEFHDTPEQNERAATWLKRQLNKDNFICLWGNHDTSHAYPSPQTYCSGFSDEKCKAINAVLNKEDWSKFKWFYQLDDYLLTHAGLSAYWTELHNIKNEEILTWLEDESHKANKALEERASHWFFRAGRARGGGQQCGGINWCCDLGGEFHPIPGVSQIYGHTELRHVGVKKAVRSINYNIDTHLMYYLIYLNGKIEIKQYIDL